MIRIVTYLFPVSFLPHSLIQSFSVCKKKFSEFRQQSPLPLSCSHFGWCISSRKKVTMIHARHAELEKDEREMEQRVLNTLDRNEDNTRRRFESVENKIDEIRRDMSYIKGNIDFLRNSGANLIQSHSPISLTNEGKEIATQIDADGIISKNWEKIRKNIELSGVNTAYDVQEYCFMTASVEPEKFFDADSIIRIKDFAYQHGKSVQIYLHIIGLLIRDKFLKEHQGKATL